MERFKSRMIQFMYGRNGADELYRASLWLYIAVAVMNIFLHSAVVSFLLTALFVWSTFRCFSRNIYKRQSENRKYLEIKGRLMKKVNMTRTMLTDKEHSFKKCPECKTVLRLPKKSGEHSVCCPKCRNDFKVKIR